ncbi:TPA: hypothetical protein ACX6SA_001000 [Photobacterium damselae]
MIFLNWIAQLNDDFLIHWANKGLLRRAKKLAQTVDSTDWFLSESQAYGDIEGHHLSLSQTDISKIQCGCGELTCCVHRLAFILVLQTCRIVQEINESEIPLLEDESEADNSRLSALSSFSIDPWLVIDCEQLKSYFRQTTIAQALKYWQQGAKVNLNSAIDHGIVHIILPNRDKFDVYLPNIFNWTLTQCRCTRNACAHKALAIIALSIQQRKLALDVLQQVESLDISQKKQLELLQVWVELVLGEGLHNLLPSRLLQAQMLITELNQVDLPHLATLLVQLCRMLEDVLNRVIDLDFPQILTLLSHLQRNIFALQQSPLPQAKALLAGEHQRQYQPISAMALVGVYIEHWGGGSDSRGYRSYFYHRKTGRWYCFVNGRKAGMDLNWSSHQAMTQDKCDGYLLQDLIKKETMLELKQSIDGSLTLKDAQCLSEPLLFDWSTLISDPNLTVIHQWQRIAEYQMKPNYNANIDTLGWFLTEDDYSVQWNSFSGWGEALVMSCCGASVVLKFPAYHNNSVIKNRLNILFGRWHLSVNQTYFEVLSQVYQHVIG